MFIIDVTEVFLYSVRTNVISK